MRLFILLLILLAGQNGLFAQHTPNDFAKNAGIVYDRFERMYATNNEKEKWLLNDSILLIMKEELTKQESFFYPYDTLKRIGKIYSSDEALRIFTWNIPLQDGTHLFSGLLQFYNKKEDVNKVVVLKDNGGLAHINIENQSFSADNWPGALYYRIIPVKIKRDRYYTLLGFIPNTIFTSQKVIDMLWVDENDKVRFGYPVFQMKRDIQHRVLFEYNARVSMNLDYLKDLELIVYDHLAPERETYRGEYEFYGPDGSFDGFLFDKKSDRWNLIEDVDMRAPKRPTD